MNGTAALYVPTNPTDLRVVNCLGYNDQGTVVSTAVPPSLTEFNGPYFGYYGPVTFYTTGGDLSEITIQGSNTNLLAGTFTLAAGPKPYATLQYSGIALPKFLMMGQ